MPAALPLADHLSLDQLRHRVRTAASAREHAHWQVVYLKALGEPTSRIALATGYSDYWVRCLLHRYNDHGPDGFRDRREDHPGAPALLNADQLAALDEALEHGRAPNGGPWTGPEVARWMEHTTGRAHVHDQRGWEYLVRLGFSSQTPRPAHDKAAPAAQAAFKK